MSHHHPQYHEACHEAVRDRIEVATAEYDYFVELWVRNMKELGKDLTKKQMREITAYAESVLLGA